MISNFTSVITWLKDITSQILAWFFDLTNTNKVLLFVVPLFVIGAIFVLFDFIVPMFYDLPIWRLNKQITVMSPKNTYGLAINKHLIPRSPYSLRRMFMRTIGGRVKTYNPHSLKTWASKELKAYTAKDIRALAPRQIGNFNIKPLSVIHLGGLTPNEMRSFSVADMRSFSVRDLNRMHLNSNILSSHMISGFYADRYRISGVNNLRVASVNYSINTSHDLTKLGKRVLDNAKSTFHSMSDEAQQSGTANDPRP